MQTERQFERKFKEDNDLNLYGYNTTTHRLRDGSIGKMNEMNDRRRERERHTRTTKRDYYACSHKMTCKGNE